ncbi:acyl-homoserine-lactone synthase [Sphingomonas sp. ERG5]|uniref:acyl-homoserine-lactone synthase n=1 Tax=Sphingomonas sp. ERG5 TaxID=1381597 RepID=UPI00054B2A95|nr:acyl-homoserine-lactone synthase [Sphingomonas sp. ERG5]
MLHLIDGTRPRLDDAVLRNMFEARKRVFVDLLGWDVPVQAGRYEIDQFDTPDALYIVITDAGGGHRASVRLLPTTRPHILDTMFAELCDGPAPSGPAIFEITRFCLERRLAARDRRTTRDELISALARFAAAHGITRYTGVAGPGWIEQILRFGWRARLLGQQRTIGGSRLGAVEIAIDADTPRLLERAGICGTLVFAREISDAA